MKRITKFIALAAIALFATSAVASAAVTVNDGVGFVGKGDVLSALGFKNDAAMQNGFTSVKFYAGGGAASKVIADYKMSCYGAPDAVGHRIISQAGTVSAVEVQAQANTHNGRLTDGWNLTGKAVEAGTFTPSGGTTLRDVPCPEGSFMYMNLGQGDLFGKVVLDGEQAGLTVSGTVNGKTVTAALPNTPVDVPAV